MHRSQAKTAAGSTYIQGLPQGGAQSQSAKAPQYHREIINTDHKGIKSAPDSQSAKTYVCAMQHLPNILNILTNGGHRFGHQSHVYGTSGQKGKPPFRMSLCLASIWCFRKYADTAHT